jgi:hypothetical protein
MWYDKILDHLDIIFMAITFPIIALIILKYKNPKRYKVNDDITEFVLKHNKYKESISARKPNNKKILN